MRFRRKRVEDLPVEAVTVIPARYEKRIYEMPRLGQPSRWQWEVRYIHAHTANSWWNAPRHVASSDAATKEDAEARVAIHIARDRAVAMAQWEPA